MSSLRKEASLAALVGVLLAYSWMFGEITVPNERSRAYLSVALVDHHTLTIDPVVRRLGPVADVARFEGRLYTDKAPGSSFLGAIPYAIARLFTPAQKWTAPKLVNLMRTWLMLPLGLLAFLLLRRGLRRLGTSEIAVDVASLAFSLGTAMFHYAAAFFGHAIVAVFLLLALESVARADEASRPRDKLAWMAAAGAATGIAGLVEYQAIVTAALFLAWVAVRERRSPAALAAYVAGALPFAAALLAYDAAAFGGPFDLPYRHLADARVQARHVRGIAGVGLPTAAATFGSLFSLHRGLLATSPVVVLAPLGLVALARDGRRDLALLFSAWIAFDLLFVWGADMWFGGWGYGPRLLVPCLGAVFLAVGPALDRLLASPVRAGFARGLAVWGIVSYVLVTFVFAELPPDFANPLVDVVAPALARGLHSPNLPTRLGMGFGTTALVPGLVLAAAAIAIGLSRGLRGLPRAAVARSIASSVLAVLLLVAIVRTVGPAASRARRAWLFDWMSEMESGER